MSKEQILSQIDALLGLIDQDEAEGMDFATGDIVTFDREGEAMHGQIEMIESDRANVRVLAVSGDNYEPTDDVLTLSLESLSRLPDDDPQTDDEPEEESEEEKGVFVGRFIKWESSLGPAVGKVMEIGKEITLPDTGEHIRSEKNFALVEVYHEHEGSYEYTGVFAGIPIAKADVVDPENVTERRLMVKMRSFQVKDDNEDDEISIEGKTSAYGKVDLGGDSVQRGAYTQTIQHNDGKVQFMFDHGWKFGDVAGVAYLDDKEDGLWIKGVMPASIPKMKDALEMIKFMNRHGKPIGLSIGYTPVKWEYQEGGIRLLKEISLDEVSITPWPMDTHARIESAKNRKFAYNANRRGWQKLAQRKSDAPTGNQTDEGDYKSLCGILTEIKMKIEERHV